MRDLRPPKRSLRAVPKLAALRKQTEASVAAPIAAEEQSARTVAPIAVQEQTRLTRVRLLVNGAGTALWLTCIGSAYSPAAAGDLRSTVFFLAMGWLLGTGAFLLSDTLTEWPAPARRFVGILFAITLAAVTGLWGSLTFQPATQVAAKEGARFNWVVTNPLKKGDDAFVVTTTNYGDMTAKASVKASSSWWISDHELSEFEEKEGYDRAVSSLPPIGEGLEILKNSSRNLSAPLPLRNEQYDAVIAGTHHLYMFTAMSFTDDLTPPQRQQLSSACFHFIRKLAEPMVCNGYTRPRFLEPTK